MPILEGGTPCTTTQIEKKEQRCAALILDVRISTFPTFAPVASQGVD
jgi:hypothetical protein